MSTPVIDTDLVLPESSTRLKLNRSGDHDEARVDLEGALNAVTVHALQSALEPVVAGRPRRVTMDIAKLTVLDSSGVGAIVWLFKRVRARGGRLALAGAHDQPLAVLKLLNLDRVLCE